MDINPDKLRDVLPEFPFSMELRKNLLDLSSVLSGLSVALFEPALHKLDC